jgi:hypothetical protein
MHPHHFQFDITASDGVIIGFNYEQSVRPFTILKAGDKGKPTEGLPVPQNTTLSATAKAGATSIPIASASREVDIHGTKFTAPMFHPGTVIGIGMDEVNTFEVRRIKEVLAGQKGLRCQTHLKNIRRRSQRARQGKLGDRHCDERRHDDAHALPFLATHRRDRPSGTGTIDSAARRNGTRRSYRA